jgi:hypothetical protein
VVDLFDFIWGNLIFESLFRRSFREWVEFAWPELLECVRSNVDRREVSRWDLVVCFRLFSVVGLGRFSFEKLFASKLVSF